MTERGFSFVEILVAVFLTISISLALLKQQWQLHRWRVQMEQQIQTWLRETNQSEQGFSLLECMLCLSFAVVLLTLLMQQYVQIKQQTAGLTQTLLHATRWQTVENLLRSSGHQAGFTPCLPIPYLHSYDHRSRQSLQAVTLDQHDPFTLTFYRMSAQFVALLPKSGSQEFLLLNPLTSHPKQRLIIADCQHAELIDYYHLSARVIQVQEALKYRYHPPIYLGNWLQESFRVSINSQGDSALFYQQNQHVDELLTQLHGMDGYLEGSSPNRWLHLALDLGHNNLRPLLIRLYHA